MNRFIHSKTDMERSLESARILTDWLARMKAPLYSEELDKKKRYISFLPSVFASWTIATMGNRCCIVTDTLIKPVARLRLARNLNIATVKLPSSILRRSTFAECLHYIWNEAISSLPLYSQEASHEAMSIYQDIFGSSNDEFGDVWRLYIESASALVFEHEPTDSKSKQFKEMILNAEPIKRLYDKRIIDSTFSETYPLLGFDLELLEAELELEFAATGCGVYTSISGSFSAN